METVVDTGVASVETGVTTRTEDGSRVRREEKQGRAIRVAKLATSHQTVTVTRKAQRTEVEIGAMAVEIAEDNGVDVGETRPNLSNLAVGNVVAHIIVGIAH